MENIMITNVGSADRIIRIVVGLFLLSALFWADESIRLWGLVGLVPLITAFVKFCPAYWILKIKSNG